jgi:hypothetical protein
MNDTSAEVARFVCARYAGMSGATRVMLGADMFELARAMALASFPPGLSERETRRRLCERFYGALAERVFGEAHAKP